MNQETEIPIPDRKILIAPGGRLLPGIKVVISGNLENNLLIKPVIGIGYPEEDLLYLDFSTIGAAAIQCRLDFVDHVFPAFQEPTRMSSNESLPEILMTEALFQNLCLVMFDLKWTILGERRIVFGICRILLRQRGVTVECDVSSLNQKDGIQLASFFERLPRM